MPSLFHNAIVHLFEASPDLVPEFLLATAGIRLPAYSAVQVETVDVAQVQPVQRYADLVVTLRGPSKNATR